ncbi:MAG: lipopolysaccharide kinase InaA family protein, partial [Planctomycetota bacterium]
SFTLVDMREAGFGPIEPSDRVKGLAQLDLYLFIRVSDRERRGAIEGYLGEEASGEEVDALYSQVRRSTKRMAWKAWTRRERRCVRENRDFTRLHGEGYRGHMRVESRWPAHGADLLGPFERGAREVLKDSAGALSILFEVDGVVIYGKRFRPEGISETVREWFRPSRGHRDWLRASALEVRGISAPRALAAVTKRPLGRPVSSLFFTEGQPGALCLDKFCSLHREEGTGLRLRSLVGSLGGLVGSLHDRGLAHRDLKASNILVIEGPSPRPMITDLDGLRIMREVPARRRHKDLARLFRTARDDCSFSSADWVRFLKAYCSKFGRGAEDLRALSRRVSVLAGGGRTS